MNEIKQKACLVFTIDSLDYLQHGGRIGKASAFAGGLLNIKPVLIVKDGELHPQAKIRGRKKSIQELVHIIMGQLSGREKDYAITAIYGENMDGVNFLNDILSKEHNLKTNPSCLRMGTTIATHAGPTLVGMASCPKTEHLL